MGIADQVAPIKIGVLIDFVLPAAVGLEHPGRLPRGDAAHARRRGRGRAARPSGGARDPGVRGPARGTVKAVIDAYGELVDEGCLGVFGPMISESAVPLREAIEDRFKVPAISWCGADEWHGEWTFSLGNGSLTDEPYVIASILRQRGLADRRGELRAFVDRPEVLVVVPRGLPGRRRRASCARRRSRRAASTPRRSSARCARARPTRSCTGGSAWAWWV